MDTRGPAKLFIVLCSPMPLVSAFKMGCVGVVASGDENAASEAMPAIRPAISVPDKLVENDLKLDRRCSGFFIRPFTLGAGRGFLLAWL